MKYWIKEVTGFTSQQKPIEYTVSEEGEQIISPDYEPYPEYTDEEVDALFAAAAEQNAMIKDVNGVPTLVARPAPTAEETQAAYEEYVNALIREKYTLSQDFAILRQKDSKPVEYAAYNEYCETCKAQAKIKYNKGEKNKNRRNGTANPDQYRPGEKLIPRRAGRGNHDKHVHRPCQVWARP